MKIESIDGELIIYLYNMDNDCFDNKKDLERYFKELFHKLKDNYNIKVSGYYDIIVYIDKIYGIILKLTKEEFDYYEYFNNQVDMHILTENTTFLYKIEDYFPFKSELKNIKIFLYKNNLYLLPKTKNINMSYIIENSKIIFENTKEIIKYGKELNFKNII